MFKDKEHKVETLLRKCTEGKGVGKGGDRNIDF